MAVDVIMPQMGESIFEGTITKWLKKPGDKIERDEPLFEISTDKVDAEIPSPSAGVLQEIKVAEGQTVPIQTVVATISSDGTVAAAPAPAPAKAEAPKAAAPAPSPAPAPKPAPAVAPAVAARASETAAPAPVPRQHPRLPPRRLASRVKSFAVRRWFAESRGNRASIFRKFPARAWAAGSARKTF